MLFLCQGIPGGKYIRIVRGFGGQLDIGYNSHRQNGKIGGEGFTVFQSDINPTAVSVPEVSHFSIRDQTDTLDNKRFFNV